MLHHIPIFRDKLNAFIDIIDDSLVQRAFMNGRFVELNAVNRQVKAFQQAMDVLFFFF